MFERFTDRARRVVVLSQEEARFLQHDYIGTEHILLGLLHEEQGVASAALTVLGVSLEQARERVEELIGRGEREPPSQIPFTPRAKKILELSLREALDLGHSYIGTEHILLGLMREGEGVGAQIVRELATRDVRAQVLSLLKSRPEERPPAPAPPPWPDFIDRLDDPALRAVLAARDVARSQEQPTVEPEHLLAGVLALEDDPWARALLDVGVDPLRLRQELADAAPAPGRVATPPRLSGATRGAIAMASGGAVGTRELLRGLLATSAAVRILVSAAGGDLDALRERLGGA